MNCKPVVLGKQLLLKTKSPWEVPKKIVLEKGFYYLFNFGVAVFYDVSDEVIQKELKKLNKKIVDKDVFFAESFELEFSKKNKIINNNVFLEEKYLELFSFLLAQRSALFLLDKELDDIMENVEQILDSFSSSKFYLLSRPHAKILTKTLYLKNYLLFDLMSIDIPEKLIKDDFYYSIYDYFYEEFDLEDLHSSINTKLDFILEAISYINEFIAMNKEVLLEVIIIVLIAVEIIMAFTGFW